MNAQSKNRLLSLDVFRGATIAMMILVNNPGSWSHVYAPLRHAEWHGWTFTDLVFPFFLFIVGVAIVYSFEKILRQGMPRKRIYLKIIRRTVILFVLGLLLNGFPFYELSTLRIMGVLQRIALCYLAASLIFLNTSRRGQWIWAVSLLLVYWAFMAWYPVPGWGAGLLERGKNFSAFIDMMLLKGHMWSYTKTWDPEGIFSTLPAISTTLFGILAGHLLRSEKTPVEKTAHLLLWGNFAVWVGLIWNYWLPINKNIWTSSYSVFMAGMALIVLAFCYYLVDLKGYQKWTKPFIIYGTNAITVYVLSGIVAKLLYIITFSNASGQEITVKSVIYQNLFQSWLSDINASLAFASTFILVMLAAMWLLYRKQIFIKI